MGRRLQNAIELKLPALLAEGVDGNNWTLRFTEGELATVGSDATGGAHGDFIPGTLTTDPWSALHLHRLSSGYGRRPRE